MLLPPTKHLFVVLFLFLLCLIDSAYMCFVFFCTIFLFAVVFEVAVCLTS